MSHDILENRVIGSVSYVWHDDDAENGLRIKDIEDDSLIDLVEQLFNLKFSADGISAVIAARLGVSEIEVTTDFDELEDGTATVYVFVRADMRVN